MHDFNDLEPQHALGFYPYIELTEVGIYLQIGEEKKASRQQRNIHHIRTVAKLKDQNVVIGAMKDLLKKSLSNDRKSTRQSRL